MARHLLEDDHPGHESQTGARDAPLVHIRLAGIRLANVSLLGNLVEGQLVATATELVNALLGPTGLITTSVAGVISNTVNPLIETST